MDFFTIPPTPPALAVSKTYIYKTGALCPIMLFIHGGGWRSGNRSDYCRPLFHNFLSLDFVVGSIDYRLLPETPLTGQLEDIRDVEPWLRNELSIELKEQDVHIDSERIVIAGGSAGAHLALLTSKLWTTSPTAILSMYGPTNMHQLPYLQRGLLARLDIPPCTAELLATATNYDKPPTEIAVPESAADFGRPRALVSFALFRASLIVEFLLRGLMRTEGGALKLPEKGCVEKNKIDEISPLHLCTKIQYPPVYQVMGAEDEGFETLHVIDFDEALKKSRVRCNTVVVPDVGHAFDMWADVGGDVDEKIIRPAVAWLAKCASVQA